VPQRIVRGTHRVFASLLNHASTHEVARDGNEQGSPCRICSEVSEKDLCGVLVGLAQLFFAQSCAERESKRVRRRPDSAQHLCIY
jgi:hypothetical protein